MQLSCSTEETAAKVAGILRGALRDAGQQFDAANAVADPVWREIALLEVIGNLKGSVKIARIEMERLARVEAEECGVA